VTEAPVRRAGRATVGDREVTWSVAEGGKGRRWREVVVEAGSIVHSLLLETFPDGRFAHLELSTPAGLLTLHPEGDGSVHGNAITVGGVAHIRGLPWSSAGVVLVEGSVAAGTAAAVFADRAAATIPAIHVRADLSLANQAVRPIDLPHGVDPDGLPVLDAGVTWPLDEEGGGGDGA
jgi:hypothetical protein